MDKLNFIDRIICALSPKKGLERLAYKNALRSYDAGHKGHPKNWDWVTKIESAELNIVRDRDMLRGKARSMEQNSDIAQAIIRAYTRNVVGKGFTLQANTPFEDLNIEFEKWWKIWCKAQHCDTRREMSFTQMLSMAVTRRIVDGGMFFVKQYIKGSEIVPLKLQYLEVDELDIDIFEPSVKENKVVSGIEYNPDKIKIGYYFKQYDVTGQRNDKGLFIPADQVIFYFNKSRPSQYREISCLASSLNRIRDMNEYMVSLAIKEQMAACLGLCIKRTIPSMAFNNQGIYNPETRTADYKNTEMKPGMILDMNKGDDVEVINPNDNSTEASNFLKLQYGLVGAGQGLSYELLSRDMSSSTYSSARQNAIEDEITFEEEIELLTTKVLDEVYESFIISGVLSNRFKINEQVFSRNKYDYLNHSWIKPKKKWIDPLKEARAEVLALQSGARTYQEIYAENGKDYRQQIRDMGKISELAQQVGINLGGGNVYAEPVEVEDNNE